jgi:hypothetical protein
MPNEGTEEYDKIPWFALFLDSHDAHVYDVIVLRSAWRHKILLLNFPGHCTHLLQPLDTGIFTSVNHHFRKANAFLAATIATYRPEEFRFHHKYFASIMERALNNAFNGQAIHNAFRKVGLVPFDRKFVQTLTKRGAFIKHDQLTCRPTDADTLVRVDAILALRDPARLRDASVLISPARHINQFSASVTPQKLKGMLTSSGVYQTPEQALHDSRYVPLLSGLFAALLARLKTKCFLIGS